MKRIIAKAILRSMERRLLADPHPFNRLMGDAVRLKRGRMTDEDFRQRLDAFYRTLDVERTKHDIGFSAKANKLDKPGGYKTDVTSIGESGGHNASSRADLWARRFGLLQHIGVRSDVLILRKGERIPPHGHHRVVSGFFVLEGRVAIRHYDRAGTYADGLLVRKALDTTLDPGGFTTNSESYHNIHWLQGLADKSFLFRVTVVDVPVPGASGRDHSDSRLYIDPTAPPDASGLIRAPFISDAEAKRLMIEPETALSAAS